MARPQRHSSKQRNAILEVVRSFDGHPTADEVYSIVRDAIPAISLGTVYRNLRLLVEEGSIAEVANPAGDAVQFDKITDRHHHFICTQCHTIFDVPEMDTARLKAQVESQTGAKVLFNRLDFYGVCPACQAGKTENGHQ